MDPQALIKDITATVQKNANANAVFGDPIDQDGVTVIPVAKVSVQGGGGGGKGRETKSPTDPNEGQGLGLGVSMKTTPLGYIKIKDGDATYERILDISSIVTGLLIVSALALWRLTRR